MIKSKIRTVPNWPKPGIMFRDITTLLKDSEGFGACVKDFSKRYSCLNRIFKNGVDLVAGIEARGFIIGGALAIALGLGFVPIRKKGKLPAETEREGYLLEYGTDIIEIHKDAIKPGQNVLVIDDLIATGGTALAAGNLVKKLGGKVVEFAFIIDLPDLGGSKKLRDAGYEVYSQTCFLGS